MNTYINSFLRSINNEASEMALVDEKSSYNLSQIRSILYQYIEWVKKFNISHKGKVVLLGKRNADSVIFFHALLLSDLVPILVDRTLPAEQIKILSSQFKQFTSDTDLADQSVIKIPAASDFSKNKTVPNFIYNFSMSKDKELFTTHTSGTTGIPKLVTYTNKNITWVIDQYQKLYKLNTNRSVLFALPFHYSFGFIACCLSPLSVGGKVVMLSESERDPRQIADLIETNEINILVINPFFYSQLCKLDLTRYDFSSLKVCDSGGEILPIEIIKKFQSQTNVLITEGYGLTETSSLTHFLIPDDNGLLRLGSVGKPCPGAECRIVDHEFHNLPNGEIGELLVKGPMVISTYDDPKYNEGSLHDDWFRTGDLFYKDENDYYYLVGRKKDAVSIPNQLHAKVSRSVPSLIQLPDIADLAYKFIDKTLLLIYIIPKDESVETRKLIEKEVTKSLPKEINKITQLRFVSSVPRTATGKVQKQMLEK